MVSIIIPVYNEKNNIARVLEQVAQSDTSPHRKEIIVIDDGSTDGTDAILRQCCTGEPFQLVTLPGNKGKTMAIRKGLEQATGDLILIQDADLEYSPADYGRLLAPFADDSVQVVYGSRFLANRWPANMKPVYWLANRLFTLTANLLYGARLTDEGTAYKVFRAGVLQSIELRGSGFEFCPEVTAKILLREIRITEVPVSYRARNRQEGKKPRIRDGFLIFWTLVKLRWT